jgi:hypothetical protein
MPNFFRPHAIVIGTADRPALNIKYDCDAIVKMLVEEEQFPQIKVGKSLIIYKRISTNLNCS